MRLTRLCDRRDCWDGWRCWTPCGKRNLAVYIGEDIDEGSYKQCVKEAVRLQEEVMAWLAASHSELI